MLKRILLSTAFAAAALPALAADWRREQTGHAARGPTPR